MGHAMQQHCVREAGDHDAHREEACVPDDRPLPRRRRDLTQQPLFSTVAFAQVARQQHPRGKATGQQHRGPALCMLAPALTS